MSKPAYVYVGAMVSTKMKDEVNQIIEQGRFTTESELFRTALRALLDNLKEEAV
jgi:Arc/MetJ-type ribon-helix-helix transcriptional regulator